MQPKYWHINLCELSYIVARGLGPDRVLSSQGNAAHGDDQQDTHLKITQGADVVTRPSKPSNKQRAFSFYCRSLNARVHVEVLLP